jgi:hypothetical protein
MASLLILVALLCSLTPATSSIPSAPSIPTYPVTGTTKGCSEALKSLSLDTNFSSAQRLMDIYSQKQFDSYAIGCSHAPYYKCIYGQTGRCCYRAGSISGGLYWKYRNAVDHSNTPGLLARVNGVIGWKNDQDSNTPMNMNVGTMAYMYVPNACCGDVDVDALNDYRKQLWMRDAMVLSANFTLTQQQTNTQNVMNANAPAFPTEVSGSVVQIVHGKDMPATKSTYTFWQSMRLGAFSRTDTNTDGSKVLSLELWKHPKQSRIYSVLYGKCTCMLNSIPSPPEFEQWAQTSLPPHPLPPATIGGHSCMVWKQSGYIVKDDTLTASFDDKTLLPVQTTWLLNETSSINETKTYSNMTGGTPALSHFAIPPQCAQTKCH